MIINQIDISSLLAYLLNVPIPSNNIGNYNDYFKEE